MQQGWIAVNRSLVDHWLHNDKPFCRFGAWVDLLLMANHEERKLSVGGSLIVIERGQLFTSSVSLSERWGWSRGKLERFLECLESDQMLTRKRTANGQLLTLVNYGFYQDGGHKTDSKRTANGQRTDSKRTADGQRTDTNNNINNDNNENNDNKENNIKPLRYFPNDERLETVFQEFLAMRKRMKKKDTEYAIKLLLSKLEKMSTDPDVQAKIIEQSIMNGWIGIFELKDTGKKENRDSLAEKWGIV
jgi:hypothetical protein